MVGACLNDIGRSGPRQHFPTLELRHHILAETLHLDELIARRRARTEDHSLDPHIAHLLHLIDSNWSAEARGDRKLQRLASMLLPLVLPQALDHAIDLLHLFADPIPSVTQA